MPQEKRKKKHGDPRAKQKGKKKLKKEYNPSFMKALNGG